ncbi:MAG TPA: tetratricopeptide repeat protein [Aquabacterium sp.]|nr:tetratricopeptide repeat protein [Aquabacterium sp.]
MATYDLEQQEQLEQVKQFWNQYGNLITWLVLIVLSGFAGWNGYNWWQNQQAAKAAGLFEELDKAASMGDTKKVAQSFADLSKDFGGTTFAQQGALMAAKVAADHQDSAQAKSSLQWLVDKGSNKDLVAIARLRLAGVQMDAKQYDDALKTLGADLPEEFQGLANDRRGDIFMSQGKKDEAVQAYQLAWKQMDPSVDYRRFVEGKLVALGHAPTPVANSASSAQ